MLEPRIILLTGNRQIGKSTACVWLVDRLRETDLKVTGLITLRTGSDDLAVQEINSGDTYPLTLPLNSDTGFLMGHFRFSTDALARTNRTLDACFPTQVFILDEIGPMELVYGQGWTRAITLLRHRKYRIAFIVVRPELLVPAMRQLPLTYYTVINLNAEIRDSVPASLYTIATNACLAEEHPVGEDE
ncbi:MAG: nucleoside-triphosphatase [Anaerolineae bacterium]